MFKLGDVYELSDDLGIFLFNTSVKHQLACIDYLDGSPFIVWCDGNGFKIIC